MARPRRCACAQHLLECRPAPTRAPQPHSYQAAALGGGPPPVQLAKRLAQAPLLASLHSCSLHLHLGVASEGRRRHDTCVAGSASATASGPSSSFVCPALSGVLHVQPHRASPLLQAATPHLIDQLLHHAPLLLVPERIQLPQLRRRRLPLALQRGKRIGHGRGACHAVKQA